ncbi:RNA polymerase, sigma-24 subunit, ECF subfamily [Streptomyces clavuligerus]|uniref:RNA polymerase, sigma-24 subunit, ECF subfamily n=1 Tax=Streptomyces clavuligerus TaxID=1901 RepID=E2PXX5_STRCL|nr:RNA polymerase, sigma-24 subunit, ECF subfamily [Streptomyces clavuligerus]
MVPGQGTAGARADDSPGFTADAAAEPREPSVPPQRERAGSGGSDSVLPPPRDTGPSDAELIQRMRAGDDSAYAELFRRHSDAVRRYARSCCRDAHTADDLTAEVFARTLQAVRGGAGPEQAVRAYLLTTVRRVAAGWTRSARREQLVEDFALFAAEAGRAVEVSADMTLDLGADVRAMREAERSLAVQAFRSLPERWQAVLWHTTVEEESPSEVAPLFGLTANATAVLASRAREGLKQAYLQAHVSSALTSGGDCARYADRLGAYARGGLRMRAERGLRKHLEECAKCRLAAGELEHVNAGIPALLPVAVIGWFAAGYSLKAAGIAAGGVAGAAGAGAARSCHGLGGDGRWVRGHGRRRRGGLRRARHAREGGHRRAGGGRRRGRAGVGPHGQPRGARGAPGEAARRADRRTAGPATAAEARTAVPEARAETAAGRAAARAEALSGAAVAEAVAFRAAAAHPPGAGAVPAAEAETEARTAETVAEAVALGERTGADDVPAQPVAPQP